MKAPKPPVQPKSRYRLKAYLWCSLNTDISSSSCNWSGSCSGSRLAWNRAIVGVLFPIFLSTGFHGLINVGLVPVDRSINPRGSINGYVWYLVRYLWWINSYYSYYYWCGFCCLWWRWMALNGGGDERQARPIHGYLFDFIWVAYLFVYILPLLPFLFLWYFLWYFLFFPFFSFFLWEGRFRFLRINCRRSIVTEQFFMDQFWWMMGISYIAMAGDSGNDKW